MDRFLDWFNGYYSIDVTKHYKNLKCIGFYIFDTVILFKRNNELYRENINAMLEVYHSLIESYDKNIDIYKYIESNTLSYDDFVKNYKDGSQFIHFLIDNLEYKPCDIKIAIKD